MSSQTGFVFGAGASSSNTPNPASSSSTPDSNQAAPSSPFTFGAGSAGSTGQFTFDKTSVSVQRHLEEQVKALQDKLEIARDAIEGQRKQMAESDNGRAMAEVRIVDLEIELEAEKKMASKKIQQLEAQLAAKEDDPLVSEIERLAEELREKEEQLIEQMEEKWSQFGQIQEVNKALNLVKGTSASELQEVEDESKVAHVALEHHLPSIEDINAGVWSMAKDLQKERKLTEVLSQRAMDLDEEVKKSKATRKMLRSFNIQQRSANSNMKTKLFRKILTLKAENQSMKKELSILASRSQTPHSTFPPIAWFWFFIGLMASILTFAGFRLVLGLWQEQLGAFGYGGPNIDNWFTRLLALICVLSEDLLLG